MVRAGSTRRAAELAPYTTRKNACGESPRPAKVRWARGRGPAASPQAALRPAVRHVHRAAGDTVLDCRGHALIEHHHDVGADCLLSFDAALRAQTNPGVVHVAGEFGVVLVQR